MVHELEAARDHSQPGKRVSSKQVADRAAGSVRTVAYLADKLQATRGARRVASVNLSQQCTTLLLAEG